MRKLLIILTSLCLASVIHAQQLAHYSQFMSNKLAQNPAYAGSKEALCVVALHRSQWVGLNGAPNTQVLSAHMPLFRKRVGVGLSIIRDDITITDNYSIATAYSYRMKLNNGTLSLGLNGTLKYIKVNWDETEAFQIDDLVIPGQATQRVFPDIGVGLYYSNPKYYFGFAAHNLVKAQVDLDESDVIDVIPTDERHFFLMGGFVTSLSKVVKFSPILLLKYVGNAPLDLDLNGSLIFHNRLWLGVTYRMGDSVDGIVQYQVNDLFRVGVAYDFTTSELRQVNKGSFEIMLDYCMHDNKKRLTNPRFF